VLGIRANHQQPVITNLVTLSDLYQGYQIDPYHGAYHGHPGNPYPYGSPGTVALPSMLPYRDCDGVFSSMLPMIPRILRSISPQKDQ